MLGTRDIKLTIHRIVAAYFVVMGILLNPIQSYGKELVGILNYSPSFFTEQVETPFFFSIGKRLKYGKMISEEAPTLFEGKMFNGDITAVFPSPDNKKAAIVSGGSLYLAQVGKETMLLLSKIDNLAGSNVRIGAVFYKWPTIQWDYESRFIYVTKDKKQEQVSRQVHSKYAVLVRIDIENSQHGREIVSDFPSLHYFMVGDDAVCFDYALNNGDVIWKCSTPTGVSRVLSMDDKNVLLESGVTVTGIRFLSYTPNIYETEIWLTRFGFFIKKISNEVEGLFSKSRPTSQLIAIKTGRNIKGHEVDGIGQYGGSVLPGGRYILLNLWHHNFKGQLLIDGNTGQYRELPKNSRVYQNINSSNYENFSFGAKWPAHNDFIPSYPFRVKDDSANPQQAGQPGGRLP